MKLKTLTLFIAILLSSGIVFGEIVATMDEVMKPTTIVIDKDQIYLVEKTTIYIYDAKTYKFKKKFGKQGEGPGEFNFFASILPYRDQLLINSFGKISYYSRQGDMIREQKIKSSMAAPSVMLFPVKDGFVGRGTRFEDKE